MATGTVYVFNTTANNVTLILNQHLLSAQLNGVQSSNGYAPTSVSAARNPSTGNPGTATFGGDNQLIVSFPDGTSQQYGVPIALGTAPIVQDLQLYIYFNQVVLVNNGSGTNIPQQTQVFKGAPAKVDVAAFKKQPSQHAKV